MIVYRLFPSSGNLGVQYLRFLDRRDAQNWATFYEKNSALKTRFERVEAEVVMVGEEDMPLQVNTVTQTVTFVDSNSLVKRQARLMSGRFFAVDLAVPVAPSRDATAVAA